MTTRTDTHRRRCRRTITPLLSAANPPPSDDWLPSVHSVSTQEPSGIDREEVRRLLREESAQLVEVLSPEAFDALHLPGAINIPLSDLDEDGVGDLDRDRPVIVYCYDDL